MTFNDILCTHGLCMAELHRRYGIPLRSMEDWKSGRRKAPDYVLDLLEFRIRHEINPPEN